MTSEEVRGVPSGGRGRRRRRVGGELVSDWANLPLSTPAQEAASITHAYRRHDAQHSEHTLKIPVSVCELWRCFVCLLWASVYLDCDVSLFLNTCGTVSCEGVHCFSGNICKKFDVFQRFPPILTALRDVNGVFKVCTSFRLLGCLSNTWSCQGHMPSAGRPCWAAAASPFWSLWQGGGLSLGELRWSPWV